MSLLTSWLASPPPDAAIQIAPDGISAAVLGGRAGQFTIQGYAVEPLPAGAVTAGLTGHNIHDRGAVVEALRRAVAALNVRPRRVALIVPDTAARVSIVPFEQVPTRRDDLEQLIRWQVRKSAPFNIDDACLTFSPGQPSGSGREFLVVIARRDTVREYESVCEAVGLHPGVVDLATSSLLHLYMTGEGGESATGPAGDWLVVHVQPSYTSVAIVRGSHVVFFRSKADVDDLGLLDVVHQTAMYHQDHLGGRGFSRVLAGGSGATDALREGLAARLGVAVTPIDPTTAATFTDRIGAAPDLLASLGPLVGVLVRMHAEAATI